jgi:metal-responsive CopG/Arc/MetJ family transcriptional regulator
MRRTQLYLDDHLWNALHALARSQKTTISELVREAVRERYVGARDEQRKAMQEFVGTRRERSGPRSPVENDAVEYVRSHRRSDRMGRLEKDRPGTGRLRKG